MGRRSNPIELVAIFVSIMALIIFLNVVDVTEFGLDTSLITSVIAVLPGLFVTLVGLIGVVASHGDGWTVGGFGVAGLGGAILLSEMRTAGIISDAIIAGLYGGMTLIQLQAIVFIASLVIGGIMYAGSNR